MSNMQCTLLTLCVIFLNEYILVAVKQMFSTRFLLDVDLTGLASSSSVDAAPLAIYTEVLFTSLSLVPSVWPHLFRGAGHEKRRGEQMKWSLAFRLCIVIRKFSMCTATRTSSYSPVGPSVFSYSA